MRECGVEIPSERQFISRRLEADVAKRLPPGLGFPSTLSKKKITSGDNEPRPGIGGRDIRKPSPGNRHRLGRDALRIACAPATRVCRYEVQMRENLSEPGLDSLAIAREIPPHNPYCRFHPKTLQPGAMKARPLVLHWNGREWK